jgi:hypothetical protein
MNALRLLCCLALACVLGSAAEIKTYQVRLTTAADGTGKGLATIGLSTCTPGQVNVPLGFTEIEALKLEEAPPGVRLEQGPPNGQILLHVFLPEGIASETLLKFSFTVRRAFLSVDPGPGEKPALPKGSRVFRHAFVNTQEGLIDSYRLELHFPEGTRAQAIREQLPKPKKSEVGPRVLLAKIDGRQAAILQFNSIRQGDDTSMQLELVPARKSLAWLLMGLILAGVYLAYFRDLVAPMKS